MKALLFSAQLCVNHNDVWICFYPIKLICKNKDFIGYNYFTMERLKFRKNIISKLDPSWFTQPVDLTIVYDKEIKKLKYINKIKIGDKVIS